MAIGKLYISYPKFNWDTYKSKLLDHSNLVKIISAKETIDCHTTIHDMKYENIQRVIPSATEIILIDLNIFDKDQSHLHPSDNYYEYGRLFNELSRVKDKVKNFDWIDKIDYNFFNGLVKQRTTEDPVLWTVGCSVTYGCGVDYAERWGSILSQQLDMPEVSLSKPGSSYHFHTDQILRSDIRSGDIVVWGLTEMSRFEYAKNWELDSGTIREYTNLPTYLQYYTLDYFDSQTKFVLAMKNILQVINYCKKINVKLYIINLMDVTYFKTIFSKMPNYIDCASVKIYDGHHNPLYFIDWGTDNGHPGPKQHREYAEKLINLIKENNHG